MQPILDVHERSLRLPLSSLPMAKDMWHMFLCLLGVCSAMHCSLSDAYISWDNGELEKPGSM